MSGLSATLSNSIKALTAQSVAINVAGKNLANVNNAGYAREQVVLSTGPDGTGLNAAGVIQLRDALLDQQVTRAISLTSALTAQQSALQNAEAGLGENITSTSTPSSITDTSGSGTGLSSSLTDFFNACQSFAANPTDAGARQTLVQQAGILADRFNSTDQSLAQVQDDLNTQITSDVGDVNTLLQSVATLNTQIASTETNAPGSAVDLRDQREAALEKLAAKLPFTAREQADGQVQVTAKDAGGNDVTLVSRGAVSGSVTFDGTTLSGGNPPVALAPASGSIKGRLEARDGAVQTVRDSLSALAAQLVVSVNTAYNPTGATGDFFNATGTTAGTLQLAAGLTATTLKASDGGAAGDTTIAQAVAGLASSTFAKAKGDAIDGTFSQYYASAISTFGQTLASTTTRLDDQSNIQQIVTSQRSSVSGVSLDEEMADLLKFQQAYQASSRVFNTVNQLLDTMITSLGN